MKQMILMVLISGALFSNSIAAQPVRQLPHIVFLVNNDPLNYEAHKTIPRFAEILRRKQGFRVTVLFGKGKHNSLHFPGFEKNIPDADLVVVFFRRAALSNAQMKIFKDYLNQGKPLIGIRTANHAFSVMTDTIPAGYEDWKEFVPEILGCLNRGYGPVELGTDVQTKQENQNHSILKNIEPGRWHSSGNVYHVAPLLDKQAVVLLEGTAGGKTEPIAWTRIRGSQRIFYTSLGYPDDFRTPQFQTLLINAVLWTIDI